MSNRSTKALNILLADDDPEDFEMFKEGIEGFKPNYIVHHINSADLCLAAVKLRTYDLIFLDINMPGSTGIDCLAEIKADPDLNHTPVVMYSTSSHRMSVERCYELRAARYLLKPVTYTGVFQGIKLILDLYWAGKLTTPGFGDFVIDTYNQK